MKILTITMTILGISFSAQAQTVNIIEKCDGYLKATSPRCEYSKKVEGGFELSSCSDLNLGETKTIVINENKDTWLKIGATCDVSVKNGEKVISRTEENASGAKLIYAPTLEPGIYGSDTFRSTLIGIDGTTVYDSITGSWVVKCEDGHLIQITDYTVETILNGTKYSSLDDVVGYQINKTPEPAPAVRRHSKTGKK